MAKKSSEQAERKLLNGDSLNNEVLEFYGLGTTEDEAALLDLGSLRHEIEVQRVGSEALTKTIDLAFDK